MQFGPPPVDPGTFASSLVLELIKKVTQDGCAPNWTRTLKMILRQMGKQQGCVVTPDPDNDDSAEFLLDLVWWKNNEDMDVVLGVESEWGDKAAIWHDFGKLMVTKAPLKLMVFDKQRTDVVDGIETYMKKFSHHIEGEHYLLLELDIPNEQARPFLFVVPSSGRLAKVKFRNLSPVIWKLTRTGVELLTN